VWASSRAWRRAARAEEHYRHRPHENYQRAMWRGRKIIHLAGGVAGVWDGTDALAWEAQHDSTKRQSA
jgi:hypothetical protein